MPSAVRLIDHFTELVDCPSSFAGQGGKFLAVNGGATAVEFVAAPGATPGGTSGQVQYNNAGAFGGAAAAVYQATTPHLALTAQGAAIVPLQIKGAVSQTAPYLQMIQSDNTIDLTFGSGLDKSWIGFAPTPGKLTNSLLYLQYNTGTHTFTDASKKLLGLKGFYQAGDTLCYGTSISLENEVTTDASVYLTAVYGTVRNKGNATQIIGLQYTAQSNAGTCPTIIGINARAYAFNPAIVTNLYGLKVDTTPNATTVNAYGVYVSNVDGASTLNYAIYTGTGSVRFGGNLFLALVKSGATQAAAGAAAGEVWKTASHATLPDNVLMIGV